MRPIKLAVILILNCAASIQATEEVIVHIIVGKLSAEYSGRGETYLPAHERVLLFKADGSVSIHADKGFKPLNYMTATAGLTERLMDDQITRELVFSSKKEQLRILLHEVYEEYELNLQENDPGHTDRAGHEDQLQEWLSHNLDLIEPNLQLVQREFQTGAGPVDILAQRSDGTLVPIEVKRFTTSSTVGQAQRYVDAMYEQNPLDNIVGYIAAVQYRGQSLSLAKKKNIECFHVPQDWLEKYKKWKKIEEDIFSDLEADDLSKENTNNHGSDLIDELLSDE